MRQILIEEDVPWGVYGEGPTQVAGGSFSDTKRQAFTGQDIRFTRKGNTLYAVALAWPGEQVTIRSLGTKSPLVEGEVGAVRLLGHDGRLEWFEEATHWLNHEEPDRVNRLLLEFLGHRLK